MSAQCSQSSCGWSTRTSLGQEEDISLCGRGGPDAAGRERAAGSLVSAGAEDGGSVLHMNGSVLQPRSSSRISEARSSVRVSCASFFVEMCRARARRILAASSGSVRSMSRRSSVIIETLQGAQEKGSS